MARTQPASAAASASTSRPPTAKPASASAGSSSAAAKKNGSPRRYQGWSRSQKCIPMQPCVQAAAMSAICRQGSLQVAQRTKG